MDKVAEENEEEAKIDTDASVSDEDSCESFKPQNPKTPKL